MPSTIYIFFFTVLAKSTIYRITAHTPKWIEIINENCVLQFLIIYCVVEKEIYQCKLVKTLTSLKLYLKGKQPPPHVIRAKTVARSGSTLSSLRKLNF